VSDLGFNVPCRTFLLVFLLAISQAANASDAKVAGVVDRIQGAAFANHRDTSENLIKGTVVLSGDRIVTGHNARVLLKMKDGALITLGADTEFVINEYRYSRKDKQGSAALELVKGAFRAVTGAIGKLKERDFKVKTAAATIGIRGTDFWGGFHFSSALDVALLGGKGIYIENAAGRVEISTIGDGTTVQNGETSPSAPIRWGDKKLSAAKASVTFGLGKQP